MSTLNRITLLALSALFALAVGASPQASAGQPAPPAAQPTALLVSATNAPLRVLGSDGLEHLEYDLIISNAFTAPVTLLSVEVMDLDGHALLRLEGDALATKTQTVLFSGRSPGREI